MRKKLCLSLIVTSLLVPSIAGLAKAQQRKVWQVPNVVYFPEQTKKVRELFNDWLDGVDDHIKTGKPTLREIDRMREEYEKESQKLDDANNLINQLPFILH